MAMSELCRWRSLFNRTNGFAQRRHLADHKHAFAAHRFRIRPLISALAFGVVTADDAFGGDAQAAQVQAFERDADFLFRFAFAQQPLLFVREGFGERAGGAAGCMADTRFHQDRFTAV
jgi:hypothetical protein